MHRKIYAVLLAGVLLPAFAALAAQEASSELGVGARLQEEHVGFPELPFYNGDFSFGVDYEYHEEIAYWQLAGMYTPTLGGTNNADYAITPQLNLIFKDRCWRGGVGALITYVGGDNDGWTDVYWQALLGIGFPIGKASVEFQVCHVFPSWEEIVDFSFGELEYALWVNFRF
jgi:hypothetical protein